MKLTLANKVKLVAIPAIALAAGIGLTARQGLIVRKGGD